jgi:hypothetical protein
MGIFGNLFKPVEPKQQKASEETLERLRRYRGADTAKWLALQDPAQVIDLAMKSGGELPFVKHPPKLEDVDKYETDDSPVYSPSFESQYTTMGLSAVNSKRVDPPKGNEQADWIEALFQEFVRQAQSFNNTANDQNLRVSVSLPVYKLEHSPFVTYDTDAKISVFKGHISTLQWGLLVQGYASKIEVYVVPADALLNFTFNDVRDRGVKPFVTIDSAQVDGKLEWHIENETISFDKLPLLAKELFGDLIRVATGKMNDGELFSDHASEMKLGETVAQGYAPDAGSDSSGTQTVADELRTWAECSNLLKAIDADLGLLAEQGRTAESLSHNDLVNQIRELSADLRTLSGAISSLLDKYTHPVRAGSS